MVTCTTCLVRLRIGWVNEGQRVVLIGFLTMKRTRDMASGWIYMDTPLHGIQGGNGDSCG